MLESWPQAALESWEQNFRMRQKMSWMIFMMGAAFLFNRHLGKKTQTELEDEAEDVLDDLHDGTGSSFFVQ